MTSPPYFGAVRYYGADGQIGREVTLDEYIEEMVLVGREVRRVLRNDGTFWCNIGDKYDKNRNLILVPEIVALALQEDGWWVRSRIIWKKDGAMPTSANNRPNNTTETILLLTRVRTGYHYDLYPHMEASERGGLRRGGDVWSFSTKTQDRGGHPAVFPAELAARCILTGTAPAGCCPRCGIQYRRVVAEHKVDDLGGHNAMGNSGQGDGNSANRRNRKPPQKTMWFATVEWVPGCACNAGDPIPCTVIDPFVGSGTTVEEAVRLGRRGIGIELNPQYAADAQVRVDAVVPPPTPPDLWLSAGDLPEVVTKLLPDDRGFCHGLLPWRAAIRVLAVLPTLPSKPKKKKAVGGRPRKDPLAVVEDLVEIARSGGARRNHRTTYRRVQEWSRTGVLADVVDVLAAELRDAGDACSADRLRAWVVAVGTGDLLPPGERRGRARALRARGAG